jgi:hypothetical protein
VGEEEEEEGFSLPLNGYESPLVTEEGGDGSFRILVSGDVLVEVKTV